MAMKKKVEPKDRTCFPPEGWEPWSLGGCMHLFVPMVAERSQRTGKQLKILQDSNIGATAPIKYSINPD